MFSECGSNNYIEAPLNANWGGHNVHLGSDIYANYNLTLVDDGQIYIGDGAEFGPNVTLATPGHPILPELRKDPLLQFNKYIHIGANDWIGAGAVIGPGVSVGEGSVIGAGSVVTRDIPANVVAYGNPCRVIRKISRIDRECFFRNERIDWSQIRK
jgi:galactoside O-acetyltransferase